MTKILIELIIPIKVPLSLETLHITQIIYGAKLGHKPNNLNKAIQTPTK